MLKIVLVLSFFYLTHSSPVADPGAESKCYLKIQDFFSRLSLPQHFVSIHLLLPHLQLPRLPATSLRWFSVWLRLLHEPVPRPCEWGVMALPESIATLGSSVKLGCTLSWVTPSLHLFFKLPCYDF